MPLFADFNLPIDGSIVGVYLLIVMIAGLAVRKYVGKVEDFLVAGREMNVYLGVASLAATEFGIISCMTTGEHGYKFGFGGLVPGICLALAMFFVGVTGFCVKPLRDAGVITIPELFEQRFGKGVRWLSGVVIVLGGLLNMGIFLRVGGEFLVVASGLNPDYLELTMTALLLAVAAYTILGGMLSVLVTDYLQFIVMSTGLIAVTLLILVKVGWTELVQSVDMKLGAGGFNPIYHPEKGWAFVANQLLVSTAIVLTWQTIIARLLAAKDTSTGRKIYTRTSFFFVCRWLLPGIWGIAALAILTPQDFLTLPADMQADHARYAMPLLLGTIVPVGLMGLLIAAMLAADMSTDSAYMLTWASVIYNDILAPFRRGRWSERRGLLWNRMIVASIGVFLLIYGLWYELEGDLWSYLVLTGTIYFSSMSVLLVACCYWKRANDWGAYGAILLGAIMPVSFLVMQKIEFTRPFTKWLGDDLAGIAGFGFAAVAMIVGSLLKPQSKEAR